MKRSSYLIIWLILLIGFFAQSGQKKYLTKPFSIVESDTTFYDKVVYGYCENVFVNYGFSVKDKSGNRIYFVWTRFGGYIHVEPDDILILKTRGKK